MRRVSAFNPSVGGLFPCVCLQITKIWKLNTIHDTVMPSPEDVRNRLIETNIVPIGNKLLRFNNHVSCCSFKNSDALQRRERRPRLKINVRCVHVLLCVVATDDFRR